MNAALAALVASNAKQDEYFEKHHNSKFYLQTLSKKWQPELQRLCHDAYIELLNDRQAAAQAKARQDKRESDIKTLAESMHISAGEAQALYDRLQIKKVGDAARAAAEKLAQTGAAGMQMPDGRRMGRTEALRFLKDGARQAEEKTRGTGARRASRRRGKK